MDAAELESRRFGRRVERFKFTTVDRDAVRAIRDAAPDLAIVRIDAAHVDQLHRLAMFGAVPIVADTLVYYGCDLTKADPRPLRNDLRFRRATPDDRPLLEELVGTVFAQYKNHYNANPTLDIADIRAGYNEWGVSFIDGAFESEAWLAYEGDAIAGFANCDTHGDTYRGVLYGVHPDFAGRGVYGDLIAYTMAHAKRTGLARMEVSTQIDNLAVQRSWVSQGMTLDEAVNTVHLNLFLSDDFFIEEHRETVTVDATTVEQFAALSGDHNPVHFDDEAARAAGFEGRIAHGVILNALISKVLATSVPGPGCIYLSQTSTFLRPVPVGSDVTVHLLTKHHDPVTNRITVSTRVHDATGAMVFCGQAVVLGPT